MRIVHYIDAFRFEVGGPVRAILDLSNALASRGHEVTVLTRDDGDVPAAWREGAAGRPRAVLLDRAGAPLGRIGRPGLHAAGEVVAGADVLHLHGVWELSNAQLAAIARRLGKPFVLSVRGMLDDWCMAQRGVKKRIHLAMVGRRMLESAAFVHLTAQAEFDQARKWFPNGRGEVIPNLLDLEPYKRLPGPEPARRAFPNLASRRPALLFLSRLHYKKGVELLLDAAAALGEVAVLIAGAGEDAYVAGLRERAARLGLGERAVFLGHVGGELKLSLYQACDLFVLPTSQENFGFVFFEALACGTPVVTTKGVDTWPELEASGGARIVDASAVAVGGAVRALLADRGALPAMGARGRAWVLDALDTGRVTGKFESMYQRAISAKR